VAAAARGGSSTEEVLPITLPLSMQWNVKLAPLQRLQTTNYKQQTTNNYEHF